MLYIIADPKGWIVLWLLNAFVYFFLLPKVGLNRKWALIPFIADRELSGIYFKNRRYYYHALVISGIFLMAGSYLRYYGRGDMSSLFGIGFLIVATLIYRSFLRVLYWKIAKSFHKRFFYRLFTVCVPFIALLLLCRRRQRFYNGPAYRFSRFIKKPVRYG